MNQPTHAIYFKDNWDGQGDLMWIFAFKKEDIFYSFDTNEMLIQFEGDEILKVVEL